MIPIDKNKRPLIAWKEYQSRLPTPEEVEGWKKQFEKRISGWAMPTGIASGIIALDFDGNQGIETFKKLGLNPNIQTASGAYHVWIKSPGYPVRTGQQDNERWPGMQVFADGGYVIVQGYQIKSAHSGEKPVTGDYVQLSLEATPLEELEEGLQEFILGKTEEENSLGSIESLVAQAVERSANGRNNAGFWLARKLRDKDIEKDEALKIVLEDFWHHTPASSHEYSKTELRNSVNSAYSKKEKNQKSKAEILFSLITENSNYELWHDGAGNRYCTLPNGESISIGSVRMRDEMQWLFYHSQKALPDKASVEAAIDNLKSIAQLEGKIYEVNIRIGWCENICYVDMGKGIFYAIDSTGWRKLEEAPPIKFVFTAKMGALPEPRNPNLSKLRSYVNVKDEDWPLLQAVLLSVYMPNGPYPVGVFVGRQGSAKSTTQSFVVSVADPKTQHYSDRMGIPDSEKDLVVAAKASRVLSWDNVSRIPDKVSDAIARLSTGGGMEYRRLYTDDDSMIFAQRRTVFLNGIGDIVSRSDLLDRSIIFECPILKNWVNERELYATFDCDLPDILAGVFNSVSIAINRVDHIELPKAERMADFERWALACDVENFHDAYMRNRNQAHYLAIEASPVGQFLARIATKPNTDRKEAIALIESENLSLERFEGSWFGTPMMLYELGEMDAVGKWDWPQSYKAFWNMVQRILPNLEAIGIDVQIFEHNHKNFIALRINNE